MNEVGTLSLNECDITNKDTYHWKNDFKGKFGIGISENIKIDEDFCELVGIWLAEGGINKCANTITFTIHKKETLLKNRIISLMWKRKHCPFKERYYKYVQEQKHIM